jgi:hypothetical protein
VARHRRRTSRRADVSRCDPRAFRKSQDLRGWITEIDGKLRLDGKHGEVDENGQLVGVTATRAG